MKSASIAGFALASAIAMAGEGTLTIDLDKLGPKVSKSMYGIFLEEINNAGEGGLYAELVQNRGFEDANLPPACKLQNGFLIPPRSNHFWENHPVDYKLAWDVPTNHPAWSFEVPDGSASTIELVTERPLSKASPHAVKVVSNGDSPKIVNHGFWGMSFKKGEQYDLSLFLQGSPVKVSLLNAKGEEIGSANLTASNKKGWQKLSAKLVAKETDPKGKLAITFSKGTTYVDFVSLFPHKNVRGLRPDLLKMITDLKPAFVRYPGGCYVEGITIESRPQWQQTLGPLEQRVPTYAPWGYWNSNGFGYHEFLQFCEDIKADALYVFNCGVSCAFRSGTYLPDEELPGLIQNTLDAIEYAVGPTSTKWGALRAKNGHPKPFPLKYVEIGNEQSGARYGKRVKLFYDAIKAKYPSMKVILSSWISGIDRAAINAAEKIDIVDEHAYTGANWAISHADHFDRYPRNAEYDLYIGEFACNADVANGNMLAALNDAAYMLGMERNADIVKMGSYAPLLENINRREWEVNLIHFDSAKVFGRASYYACRMFAENLPDQMISAQLDYKPTETKGIVGPIGLGTYGTSAEFKDIKLEIDGKPVDVNQAGWKPRTGDWKVRDTGYAQLSQDWDCWSYFGDGYHDLTLSLKARKLAGGEGFVVSPGEVEGKRLQFNVGGWGNGKNTLELYGAIQMVDGHVDTDRWYDIRIVTKGREVTTYLDGKQVFKHTPVRADPVLTNAGYDHAKGELVVKVINPGSESAKLTLNLPGAEVGSKGTVTSLSSPDLTAENSFDEPNKIVPVTRSLTGLSNSFIHEFAPHSISILRIPVRRTR